MFDFILSIFGNVKNLIIGLGSIIGGLWFLLLKRRVNRQQGTIDRQEQVIRTHEAKEVVHRQDQVLETEADQKIEEIREQVKQAESPEQAAQAVVDSLNEYFRREK